MELMHCFGTDKTYPVHTELAVQMIKASGISEITLNTHNIESVDNWEDLQIGYGDATWRKVFMQLDSSSYRPIFNINLPENDSEAIWRTETAISLNPHLPIKLEVLNKAHDRPGNKDVVSATRYLKNKYQDLQIWPLIEPDLDTFFNLKELKCPMIRVLGSSIGSLNGISQATKALVQSIIDATERPTIVIDGGVGSDDDIKDAKKLRADRVLVNSFLFKTDDPVTVLFRIKEILNNEP